MKLQSIDSFETVVAAIAYYTGIVADYSKRRDYSNNDEILAFKKQLHDRIKREKETGC